MTGKIPNLDEPPLEAADGEIGKDLSIGRDEKREKLTRKGLNFDSNSTADQGTFEKPPVLSDSLRKICGMSP